MAHEATFDERNEQHEGEAVTSTPTVPGAGPVKKDMVHATEASGYKGDNPGTAGPGPTAVKSNTPENKEGRLNPSAPEDSNTTPGTTGAK